jgi:SET domain-containing protein
MGSGVPIKAQVKTTPKVIVKAQVKTTSKVIVKAQVKTTPKVIVKELPNNHSARNKHSKYGLFATEDIVKGETIGEYIGILCTKRSKSHTSRFVMKHSDDVYIDAEIGGNETMFINDYRNISSVPNAKFVKNHCFSYHSTKTRLVINGIIMVIASSDIKQDEEIVVNYGEGYCKKWGIVENLNN